MARRAPTRLVLALTLALLGIAPSPARAAPPTVSEATVQEVAARLRCVVCQNLSVADSPSETASQMRAIIRERLAAGEPPERVVQYFVDRYGEWILLAPRPRGFNLLVWSFPLVAIVVGLGVVAALLRRWTRRARDRGGAPAIDPAMLERIRREVETEP